MSEIYVDRDALAIEFTSVRDCIYSTCLQPLSDNTTDSTVVGHPYILRFYDAFKNLINTYFNMILRDAAVIGDMALSLLMYDNLYGDITDDYSFFNLVDQELNGASICFSVDGNFTLSNTWEFFKRDCDTQIAEIQSNIIALIQSIDPLKAAISSFSSSESFRGEAADAAKSYFNSIHIFGCNAIYTIAQNALMWINVYWLTYRISRDFEEDCMDRCWLGKVELTEFIAQLQEKYSLLEEWHPQIAQRNSILSSETAGTYDYYNSLTGLFSLPDYIQDIISRCSNVIDTVESLEGSFATVIQPNLENPTRLFCEYAQQLTDIGTRSNYANPPVDLNASYSLENYAISFCEIQTRNEIELSGTVCTGVEEVCEVNTELNLEAAAEARGSAILSESVTILGAVVSIIASAGTDAPVAIICIAQSANVISCICHTANMVEDYSEIQMIHQGELDPNGVNFIRDSAFGFVDDQTTRQTYYNNATYFVDNTAVFFNGAVGTYRTAGGRSNISLSNVMITTGSRTAASRATRNIVYLVTQNDYATQIIMVPANAAINYSINTYNGVPNANYQYSNPAEAAIASFAPNDVSHVYTDYRIIVSAPIGASSTTISDNSSTYTSEWLEEYNGAYAYGLVGGGFYDM